MKETEALYNVVQCRNCKSSIAMNEDLTMVYGNSWTRVLKAVHCCSNPDGGNTVQNVWLVHTSRRKRKIHRRHKPANRIQTVIDQVTRFRPEGMEGII